MTVNDRLPAPRPRTGLARRVRSALQPYAEVVVPSALVGAGYLLAPGHWAALKTLLAAHGVPPGISGLGAPVVAVVAFVGLRHLVRLAAPSREPRKPDGA